MRLPARLRTLLALCLTGLIGACSPAEPPSGSAGDAPSPAESGAVLFNENCGACHGAGGRGPSLETLKALSSEALRDAIRNHPTAGQIPNRLPANEIGDLIEFLDE